MWSRKQDEEIVPPVCQSCNIENLDGSRYCINCGRKMKRQHTSPRRPEREDLVDHCAATMGERLEDFNEMLTGGRGDD